MNKNLLYILIFAVVLNTSCSTRNSVETSVSPQHTAEIKEAPSKQKKHKHHIPEGVISADIFNDNNRLHLLTGKHSQGKKSLWYQYSTDGGKSWSIENKILNDDNISAKIVRGNDAQITAQGSNVVVSWTKHDKTTRFHAGAMLAARSTDGGETWQYSEIPPDWKQGPHGYIDMTADNHAMHAVWLDSRNGPSGVNASQGLRYL